MSAPSIVGDPRWLPHDLDLDRRLIIFRRTSEDAVRGAGFLDGRTDIWTGQDFELPFDAADEVSPTKEGGRYIFHMSFCGSTLLARLLDRPGTSLTLREPDILVKLADWRSALLHAKLRSADYDRILRFVEHLLFREWNSGEPVTVKPSSWANNLIGDLHRPKTRSIFVTIERETFAIAVLRGGRDRLAFAARLASHLASAVAGGEALLRDAIESCSEPLAKAVKLALVAHELQRRLFAEVSGQAAEVAFASIEDGPSAAAQTAARILGLNFDQSSIESNVARWASAHAKGQAVYSSSQRSSENAEVRRYHGEVIRGALAWADATLGR